MKSTCRVIYFISFLAVLSCESQFIDEENKLQQENIEALTKSVPVVCVDLYVRWDDSDIYLGTACSGVVGGGGSGSITGGYDPDDIIESPSYTPGGIPDLPNTGGGGSSGGGTTHYNPSTGKQEYVFTNLKQIYDIGSTLDIQQKSRLDKIINSFKSTPTGSSVLNYMVSQKVKIKFYSDPFSEHIAHYETSDKSIIVRNFDSVTIQQMIEELLHAVQHQCFYGKDMVDKYRNFEFEVKVYFDLAGIADGVGYNLFPVATDSRAVFVNEYTPWIDDIYYNRYGQFKDVWGFNRLGKIW
ncbi:hypothetical protein [Parabacteroides timonensis]|uniref:hypothetical protein n=1 Tax=Parabacteroides timonensis TaxID=1871013 RepID=UPI00094E348E|nr:hypothetical protein [Parabacteroides timonensis]